MVNWEFYEMFTLKWRLFQECFFPVRAFFIILYRVVLIFDFVDEILKRDYLKYIAIEQLFLW